MAIAPITAADSNVGSRLSATAATRPEAVAVVMPRPRRGRAARQYDVLTFRQLDDDSNRIASGLLAADIPPSSRLVLLVRPSIEFVALVFALLKARMVTVLIDPGMGRANLLRCLEEVRPDGFVAIPAAQAVRSMLRSRFPQARHLVTVGRRWFWGGWTLDQIRRRGTTAPCSVPTVPDDPAAIIFTTGSTGPPKGVLYRHRNFCGQVDALRDFYGIQPGEVDLPGFPLFALFNFAMGVTTVIPDMDATRPARVDPRNVLEAVRDWQVTQAFGSPAMWNTVGRYCEQHRLRMASLRRVFSAGAPVPPHVLRRMRDAIDSTGEIHTPYGATEALPVASISARQILAETAERTQSGAGYCVGRRFPGIQWKVIPISDQPLTGFEETVELERGQIGELVVRGEVVTSEYATRQEANTWHKIHAADGVWHRMGDVGYLDGDDRFWFCGRKSHRLQTPRGVMFTIPCEAIFNCHPAVYRSALVGVGTPGQQRPAVVVEPWPECWPRRRTEQDRLRRELRETAAQNALTEEIEDVFLKRHLPVDIRHNAKIFREQLAVWVARRATSRAGSETP